jgi:sterol 3beta-glucosyltransferase
MTITMLAIGSRGDVQPYIALGVELQRAGYAVRVATFANFASFVTQHGLEFYPIRGDVAAVASSAEVKKAGQADNPLRFLQSFNKLKSLVFELQQDFWAACEGATAVVYHPGVAIGYFIAQELGIPSILATPFPMTPTRAYPNLIFYDRVRLGKGWNWLTHKLFEQIMWQTSKSPIKRFWREKFGRLPAHLACPYPQQTSLTHPTITSCSNDVFAKPADWPAHVHNTGYWFLEGEADWQPSAELLAFLAQGPPPVYVGFGSLGDSAVAEQTTALVVAALQQAGQRGVLATGWSGMAQMADLPPEMFMLESAPHAWLFPQMAAVVHHGGAGTTAAGFRAGVPSIVIPHSNDQFAWGRRVAELGVGAPPIPRKRLTAEGLAGAIGVAMQPAVREAARVLGEKIAGEEGVKTAAAIIVQSLETVL